MRTGIDLVEIGRIRASIQDPRFVERVYTPAEREFLFQRNDPAPGLAANFAAKEAFAKALGTGVRGMKLNEIGVLRDELGAPYFELSGGAARAAGGLSLSVSLSHTGDVAAAFVLAYSKKGDI